jgi:crotonobetaine/carnitine-CoA ligase
MAGEIIVRPLRPDIMFMGYWRRPEDTQKLMRNLWLHTGDIGKFDEEGFFYFVDRKKDYLRRRGENISSFEMEAAFAQATRRFRGGRARRAFARGEDDVKVTAILHPGATLAPEDLFRWATGRGALLRAAALHRVPRRRMPKNPQGRVLKYQLRDEGKTAATWDQETSGITVAKR